jgi:hypothetical protein
MGLERFMLPRAFGPRNLLIGWQLLKRREKAAERTVCIVECLNSFPVAGRGSTGSLVGGSARLTDGSIGPKLGGFDSMLNAPLGLATLRDSYGDGYSSGV